MHDPRTIIQSHGVPQQIWPVGVHPAARGRRLHPLENTSRLRLADVCICTYMYVYTYMDVYVRIIANMCAYMHVHAYMHVYIFIRDINAEIDNSLHSYTGLVAEVTPVCCGDGCSRPGNVYGVLQHFEQLFASTCQGPDFL